MFVHFQCMYVCMFFFSGRGGSKLPGQQPCETVIPLAPCEHSFRRACSDQLEASLLYPYSLVPFSLAAKRLGVRALHFSIFRQTPLGHLRLLLFYYAAHASTDTDTHAQSCTPAHTHAHTHAHPHAHSKIRASISFFLSTEGPRFTISCISTSFSLLCDHVPDVERNLVPSSRSTQYGFDQCLCLIVFQFSVVIGPAPPCR